MGLSIHYSGRLRDAKTLQGLIDEVQDIVIAFNWEYAVVETVLPDGKFSDKESFDKIYGISFTPAGSETIFINFLSNGRMINPISLLLFGNSENEDERKCVYTTSVKTQYAGIDTHQSIILFFKYLNKKYFDEFIFHDESYYWETEDEAVMQIQFNKYNRIIDNIQLAIQSTSLVEDEDIEDYLVRLFQMIHRNKK